MSGVLSQDDVKVEIIRLRSEGETIINIAETFGIGKTSVSDFLNKRTYKDWWATYTKPIAAGELYDHHEKIEIGKSKTYVITSAQNSTFVHRGFWKSLKVYAEEHDAEILVGTYSYNKNGFQNLEKSDGDWFDPEIKDYIVDKPIQLASGLVYCGELNILPTAVNPLSGLQSYTRSGSGIIPHAKVQMESLPRHKHDDPRFLYTTGTVTKRNYIQKKSGQKASFHHVFGALVVEINKAGDWFVRQLIADSESGHFYDLDTKYTPEGCLTGYRVEAINWGDIHIEKMFDEVAQASFFGDGNMLDALKPKYQFCHDVYDAGFRSHHIRKDYIKQFEHFCLEKEEVKVEIKGVADFLNSIERDFCQTIVVNSNHDRALDRWLNETDYRFDHINALFFLELQLLRYKGVSEGKSFVLLEEAIRLVDSNWSGKCKFLKLDESFTICGNIECGMHGDIGVSGTRGTANGFSKVGSKCNIGHSHSARIFEGVYQAGTLSELDMGYNKGPSNWSHSNIITYPNGKRAIVTIKNGKWRA